MQQARERIRDEILTSEFFRRRVQRTFDSVPQLHNFPTLPYSGLTRERIEKFKKFTAYEKTAGEMCPVCRTME